MSTNNEDRMPLNVKSNLLITKHVGENVNVILLLPSLIFIYANICEMGMIVNTLHQNMEDMTTQVFGIVVQNHIYD